MLSANLIVVLVSTYATVGLTQATKPEFSPFQLVADLDDTSYFSTFNGSFYMSQNPCQMNCPFYKNGTVLMIDSQGRAFLDVAVAGGQQVYVDPEDDSLRYTRPGSPTPPAGAITTTFDRVPLGPREGVKIFALDRPSSGIYDWFVVPPRKVKSGSSDFDFGPYRDGKIFVATYKARQRYPKYGKQFRMTAELVKYFGPSPAVESYP